MQLHACLLLLVITTDKTLALSQHLCGGDVSLDQKPSGHINLTLPGLVTDFTDKPNTITHHTDETTAASVCTWTLNIPQGQTVLLRPVGLESSSSIFIRCAWNEKDQIVEVGGGETALLSGCDRNKATVFWTGAGRSPDVIQLSYTVQEDDTHSTEDHTSPHPNQDRFPTSQTGTSFTRPPPIGGELGRGTEGSKGRIYEIAESSSGPYPSFQDQRLLHPASSPRGLGEAGGADRETLPLPEEELNNRADTSGAAHLTDAPTSAGERTHPYFYSTGPLFHALNAEHSETLSRNKLQQTQSTLTHETRSRTNHQPLFVDKHKLTATSPTVSSPSSPQITTSAPETTSRRDPLSIPRLWAVPVVPGERQHPSKGSHRSTSRLNSDTTPTFTSDPSKSPNKPSEDVSSIRHNGGVYGSSNEKLSSSWSHQSTHGLSLDIINAHTSGPLNPPNSPPEKDSTSASNGAFFEAPNKRTPQLWSRQQTTDILNSDITSAITSDPLKPPPKALEEESVSALNEAVAEGHGEKPVTSWSHLSANKPNLDLTSTFAPDLFRSPDEPLEEDSLSTLVKVVFGATNDKPSVLLRDPQSTNGRSSYLTSDVTSEPLKSTTELDEDSFSAQNEADSREGGSSSWRSYPSTNGPNFDFTATIKSNPLNPPTKSPLEESSSAQHRGVSGDPGERQPLPWRSHRSTDDLNSNQTFAITFEPSDSSTELPEDSFSSQNGALSGALGGKPTPAWGSHQTTDGLDSYSINPGTSAPLISSTEPSESGIVREKNPPSWRGHRSADGANSTSDPMSHPTKTLEKDLTSYTDTEPTAASITSFTAPTTGLETTGRALEAASFRPNASVVPPSDITSQTGAFEPPDMLENTTKLKTFTSSFTTGSPQSTESVTQTPHTNFHTTQDTQTATESSFKALPSSPVVTKVDEWTTGVTDWTQGPIIQTSEVNLNTKTSTLSPSFTLLQDSSTADSQTSALLLSTSEPSFIKMMQEHSTYSTFLHSAATVLPLTPSTTQSAANITPKMMPTTSETTEPTSSHTQSNSPTSSSTDIPIIHEKFKNSVTTAQTSTLSLTTVKPTHEGGGNEVEVEKNHKLQELFPISTTPQTPTAGSPQHPAAHTSLHPIQEEQTTLAPSIPDSTLSSTTSRTPKYYIVPDLPAAIREESIELLLQIIVEESRSTLSPGLVEDTAAWLEPYLLQAPGFNRLLGVWSSGHAVQSLVQFKTREALQWLSSTGPTSLLERTGLTQALREGRKIRSSRISNITLGGVQADVCAWLLKCPSGYECVSQPGSSNYSCSSVCHFDYCHHHGICTHHPEQPPVCRCLVGEDFWYMGQRCDVRMTRGRLVGACLAILLIMVTVIGVLALVAVRRYKAALIQAKVDQTRSSYRRFNHFDELSGRFWLRSWAGSADSLDNPAFTRSDELLHLRALDRPCCYHDDTLSLASTCPSHGTRINTIYPHSSQYGLRGSEVSIGDGVLDSGKASDLSVCSWPVEPIQWTPFPLLQQLASHRAQTVRVSRPRSYCEGMELVDITKSWTA